MDSDISTMPLLGSPILMESQFLSIESNNRLDFRKSNAMFDNMRFNIKTN